MITLKTLAVTNLSCVFARRFEGNKIRHYVVGSDALIYAETMKKSAQDLVKEYIKKTENEDVEILPYSSENKLFPESDLVMGTTLKVKDVSDLVLKNDPSIREALEAKKIEHLVHQYNHEYSFSERFFNPLKTVLNVGIQLVNRVLSRLQGYKYEDALMREWQDNDSWEIPAKSMKLVPYFQVLPEYVRRVVPVRFLSISFEEDRLEEATELLRNDLRTLDDRGLIFGHLAMPSLILLADTIGSGKSQYALFCFLAVDDYKLYEQEGTDVWEAMGPDGKCLVLNKLLGLKTETCEGGINHLEDVYNKYQIENIYVRLDADQLHEAYLQSYKDSVPMVNAVAAQSKSFLETKKITKESHDLGNGKILVNVKIEDA